VTTVVATMAVGAHAPTRRASVSSAAQGRTVTEPFCWVDEGNGAGSL
jgi:hypothetical protein